MIAHYSKFFGELLRDKINLEGEAGEAQFREVLDYLSGLSKTYRSAEITLKEECFGVFDGEVFHLMINAKRKSARVVIDFKPKRKTKSKPA